MEPRAEPGIPEDPEAEQIREIVPARAVLTELARGFLLEHESNPHRALLFAETFLKEQTGRTGPSPGPAASRVSRARLGLGLLPRGAVEPAAAPKRADAP